MKQKVKVRMIVEYEIECPGDWDKYDVEFHRNESSWCATNAIDELSRIIENKSNSCLCDCCTFEVIDE